MDKFVKVSFLYHSTTDLVETINGFILSTPPTVADFVHGNPQFFFEVDQMGNQYLCTHKLVTKPMYMTFNNGTEPYNRVACEFVNDRPFFYREA